MNPNPLRKRRNESGEEDYENHGPPAFCLKRKENDNDRFVDEP